MNHSFTLNNGVTIPAVGFGTWQAPSGETAAHAVRKAIQCGYRHIDGAACYKNEKSVGEGIQESGIDRHDLFITSKVWNTNRGYQETLEAFEKTCMDLGVDYLDLYLIHWPANEKQFGDQASSINLETWRAMMDLYRAGRIKAIGVSNFLPHHLEPLMKTEIPPMVNQIEYHPGTMWPETVEYCKAHNILVEAWSPLGSGRVLADERLVEIAEKYQKSTAQLCIRWALQNGVLPLPKSITPERIASNFDVMDFEITPEDMEYINHLPEFGGSGLHPDQVDF